MCRESKDRYFSSDRGACGLQEFLVVLLLSLAGVPASCMAVVVNSGDGSGNTVAPKDDPGFANVGQRGVATAVYLGNRWAITAAHVRAGTVRFGDQDYRPLPSETQRLENPDGTQTDLLLFRIADSPELPSLRLPCGSPELGGEVIMIGHGHDRASDPTFWRVEEGPRRNDDVWERVSTEGQSDRQGFQTVATQTIRWGRGSIGTTDQETPTDLGDVQSFSTSFSRQLGVESLAQAVRGDSGGAVFGKSRGVWELAGIIVAVDPYENQPGATRSAIYGNITIVADLDRYRDQIRSIADFEPQPVDLNGDGSFSADEIDDLFDSQEFSIFASCHFDVDGNGRVDELDVDAFFESGAVLPGDANLDGSVDFVDFLTISNSYGTTGNGWADGDFDGDGSVGFADFLTSGGRFGQSTAAMQGTASVPEARLPSWLLGLATCWIYRFFHGRRAH